MTPQDRSRRRMPCKRRGGSMAKDAMEMFGKAVLKLTVKRIDNVNKAGDVFRLKLSLFVIYLL